MGMGSWARNLSKRGLLGLKGFRSQAKLAMRADAHELQYFFIGLAVDQNQVGLDMTVPVVFPVASESVVAVARLQRLIAG